MTQEESFEKATKYAPIFAQKVSDEWKAAEQIAPVDFVGSLKDVHKNPDKLFKLNHDDSETIKPKIYYSVCETNTHYFIVYAVYHILDWWKRLKPNNLYDLIRDCLDEHIHDMEGALFVITKKPRDIIDGVITIAHNNFYLYSNPKPLEEGTARLGTGDDKLRIVKFNETIDGDIWRDKESKRVKLYIESKGHGIYGDHKRWGGGEEIWYYRPQGEEHEPRPKNMVKPPKKRDNQLEIAKVKDYELEDIFAPNGLWNNRFDKHVFMQNKNGRWGFVYYDKKKKKYFGGSANPPWSWNDHNDNSPIGEIATDPARFIIRYAQGWGPVSTQYVFNLYQSIH